MKTIRGSVIFIFMFLILNITNMMLNIYYEDKRKELHKCLTFTTDFERNAAVGRIDSSKIELYHKTNSMTKIKIQELKDTWIYIKIYQVVWIVLFTVSATIYFIYKVLHHSFPG